MAVLACFVWTFGSSPSQPFGQAQRAHAQAGAEAGVDASVTPETSTPEASATPASTSTEIATPTATVETVATLTPTPTSTPTAISATPAPIVLDHALYLPFVTVARNDAPVILAPLSLSTSEDTPVSFTLRVTDIDNDPATLLVSVSALSPTLLPSVAVAGAGITRTVWITPGLDQFGQTGLTLTASDGRASAQAVVQIDVLPVNDAPVITGLTDIAMRPNLSRTLALTVTDVESASQQLSLSLEVADPALLPLANTAFAGAGPTRTLTITPSLGLTGTSVISVSVSDGMATSTLPFTLTVAADACPDLTANRYITIAIQPFSSSGLFYKDNRLTDENADFRLSILGYTATAAITDLVDYGGDIDPLAPRLYGVFKPKRPISITRTYKRYDWIWDEAGPPPYGVRGGVNHEWPASVIDLGTNVDEPVYIPERPGGLFQTGIWEGDYKALVLYASEHEVLLTYTRNDRVDHGYAAYLANLCVDPNLVRAYREQLSAGRRSSGWLPALRNTDVVGTARGTALTVAVRDSGPFLDPRSRKDWWQGY